MTARRVSLSELRRFRRCRRSWWLQFHRRLVPKRPEVVGPRPLGTRVHAALEVYYQPGTERKRSEALDQLTRMRVEDLATMTAQTDEPDVEALDKEHELAWLMVEGYLDWLDETGFDAGIEVLGVEQNMELEVEMKRSGTKYILAGRADKLIRRADGRLVIRDFKTVGNLADLPKTADLNEQGVHYWWLLERVTEWSEPIAGVEFVMLRKVKRTARAKPPFYASHEVQFNRHQLEAWGDKLHGMLLELEDTEQNLWRGWPHRLAVYPTPTRACSWDCDFLPVCAMLDDGSRAEDAIDEFYYPGDPYERYHATEQGD